MSIQLTERAIVEVKKVMEEQTMSTEEYALRVGVAGGGCSGYSYQLQFEKKEEGDGLNDTVYQFGDVETRVDRKSELYLEGTTIDFYTGLEKRGFTFQNPQATRSCGCGSSFSCG